MTLKTPTTILPWIPCLHCNAPMPLKTEITIDYFKGIQPNCAECRQAIDWWHAILRVIQDQFVFFYTFGPVGAISTVFHIHLQPEQVVEVRFADHGIPQDAQILNIVYTPQNGNLIPVELHGNSPPRHIVPNRVTLYPKPFKGELPKDTELAIYVTWVECSPDNVAWSNLVDAFEAYASNRHQLAIIPANVAVESRLERLLFDFLLRGGLSRDRVDSFFRDGATYSHQLNIILPMITGLLDVPSLPDQIRGALNGLRELRHKMAHKGSIEKPLDRKILAEYLCGALFGFHYINMISPLLLKTR